MLQLNGAIAYFQGLALEFETVSAMSDAQWKVLLNARFPGQTWRRWFGKTSTAIYSVVVVEGDEATGFSPAMTAATDNPNDSMPRAGSASLETRGLKAEGDGCTENDRRFVDPKQALVRSDTSRPDCHWVESWTDRRPHRDVVGVSSAS